MLRVIILCLSLLLLSGMTSCGPHLQQRNIVAFELTVPDRYFSSNTEIDLFTHRIAEYLGQAGFNKGPNDLSASWGLQPLTRHTRHLRMNLERNGGVLVYVSVARCCISVDFTELETEIGSNEYSAVSTERQQVTNASTSLKRFLEESLAIPFKNLQTALGR